MKIFAAGAFALLVAAGSVSACNHLPKAGPEKPAAYDYAPLFAEGAAPKEDAARFAARKTQTLIEFTGARPGMTIIDVEAGDGINTELFSKIAGESGKVYLQNPKEFDRFVSEPLGRRLAAGRLANVKAFKSPFDDLSFASTSEADLVLWSMGPHELWYTPEGAAAGALGKPEKAFSEIARVLKRGGHFVVLDHQAPKGAPATTGGEIHRLDKAILLEMAKKAGFVLAGESDAFANPSDKLDVNVFDPSVQGKTDRYLLKFRKK